MLFRIYLIIAASVFLSTTALAIPECGFVLWESYKDTQLMSHSTASAYVFTSDHMAVEADGAPNAYHPDDVGLDFIANAGYPNKSWWNSVLVPDPSKPSRAYTQSIGEFTGYFVSKTSLQDKTRQD